jgi:hypothetical protein
MAAAWPSEAEEEAAVEEAEAAEEAAVEERRDTDSLARRRSAARCMSPLLSANACLRQGQDRVRVGGTGVHGGGRGRGGGTELEEESVFPPCIVI